VFFSKNCHLHVNIINQLDKIVKIFSSRFELAEKFAEVMANMIIVSANQKKNITIALSGGSTPELLYTRLFEKYGQSVPWQNVHFFWGDERCVSPDNIESNFGMARTLLLNKIKIPPANIHRIKGEEDPAVEARRYSEEISQFTLKREGLPVFDLILLGLGEDGHTASIFPGHLELFDSDKICEVATHPVTMQKRLTFTGKVINNADAVVFLVSGKNKSGVIERLFKNDPLALNYPASRIVPVHGSLSWFIDKESGILL
jgi:6-phosphogluconolactonase